MPGVSDTAGVTVEQDAAGSMAPTWPRAEPSPTAAPGLLPVVKHPVSEEDTELCSSLIFALVMLYGHCFYPSFILSVDQVHLEKRCVSHLPVYP